MSLWRKCGAGSACDTALVRFAATGHGDVKPLKDRPGELRLRVGKWRVFFYIEPPDLIPALGIDNRGGSLLNALRSNADPHTQAPVKLAELRSYRIASEQHRSVPH